MKFCCRFIGGPYDGRFAKAVIPTFKIGSVVSFSGNNYIIADGPAAKWYEKEQKYSDVLMCNVVFVPPLVDAQLN